jgi:predicted PurR-regulated permease PerM
LNNIVPSVVNLFSGVFNVVLGLVGLIVILLYLIFILIDYDAVMVNWKDLLHSNIRDQIVDFVEDFEAAMSNYFRAQTLIAFLVGVLFAIGFWLIGLPLAIIFGLFVGLLNLVPYLQTVAIIPAAFLAGIYCLEHHSNFWWMMMFVLMVFAVVQLIQDAFLTPRIMGKATGLNPAMMLLALAIWGKLLGMLGLIIALPITFLLVSYYKSFLKATGSMSEAEEDTKQIDGNIPAEA